MENGDSPKIEVLVCMPALTRGGVHPRTVQSLWATRFPPKDQMAVFMPIDRPTTSSRSDAVRQAQSLEAGSLLFLDSDMEWEPDLYERLNAVNADIVCGLFWQRRVPSFPTIVNKVKAEDGTDQLHTINPDGSIQEVDACGMAATLIRKSVLDWCEYPSFAHHGFISEDFEFCLRARAAGFRIKCDTSIKVAHRGDIGFNGQPVLTHPSMNVLSFPFGEVGDGSTIRAV